MVHHFGEFMYLRNLISATNEQSSLFTTVWIAVSSCIRVFLQVTTKREIKDLTTSLASNEDLKSPASKQDVQAVKDELKALQSVVSW
jgi:hypothetical protein